jgi:uncharacterized protein YbcI
VNPSGRSVLPAEDGCRCAIEARNGVLSPAEQALAASPAGAAQLQEFHQQLFQISSDPLRREIKRITGLEICELAKNQATAAVQVFSVGTVVQVFLLAGRLPADTWEGT